MAAGFALKLGLAHPIVLAPMAGVSGAALASAVGEAGALGLLGVGYSGRKWVDTQVAEIKRAKPLASHALSQINVGFGFNTWYQSHMEAQGHPDHVGLVEHCLSHKPKAMCFSFGDARRYAELARTAGICTMWQVCSVREAVEAAPHADVIVVQGAEAGGHGTGQRSLFAFVPAAVDALRRAGHSNISIVAAGGIGDGRGLAASLCLGASGVMMGTRFCAARESMLGQRHKRALVVAHSDDTTRTPLIDILRGPLWPPGYDGRVVRNALTLRWKEPQDWQILMRDQERRNTEAEKYRAAAAQQDPDETALWAGEGVDHVTIVDEPAADIIRSIIQSFQERCTTSAITVLGGQDVDVVGHQWHHIVIASHRVVNSRHFSLQPRHEFGFVEAIHRFVPSS